MKLQKETELLEVRVRRLRDSLVSRQEVIEQGKHVAALIEAELGLMAGDVPGRLAGADEATIREQLEARGFLPNPLVVIAPPSHRLVGRVGIPLQELASERFILREKGSGTRLGCDAFFKEQGFQPKLRLELGSNEAIKQSVAGGMGLSVLSRHALGEHLGEGSLVILDVAGFPIHSNWFTVTLRGKRLSPTAAAFLEYLNHSTPVFEG